MLNSEMFWFFNDKNTNNFAMIYFDQIHVLWNKVDAFHKITIVKYL